MSTPTDQSLVAHVRRLAADGRQLYVRIGTADIRRLGLTHGEEVEVDVGGAVCIRGVVKTSGGSPWLAPGRDNSNDEITAALRQAGFEHPHDVPSVLRVLSSGSRPGAPGVPRDTSPATATTRPPISATKDEHGVVRIDRETAIRAVRVYNAGSYRGRSNLEIDRIAYERFRGGLPEEEGALVELICLVGEDYGGAQRRFLPHSYRDEAALIVCNLRPVLEEWRETVEEVRPLVEEVPERAVLEFLFRPFKGTKRWPVWASKTLHFLRPEAFPILDSRAKKALGMAALGSSPGDYWKFCSAFRATLLANRDALAAAHGVDAGASPTDLKLLDKILYELGG